MDNPEGVEEDWCLSLLTVGGCEADLLSSLVLPDQLKTPRPKLAGLAERDGDAGGLYNSSLA